MKIAFVYDRINKFGGAERILLALHELWPNAPIYTAVYDAERANWARDIDIRPSWMQYVPFAKRHHELYPWLTPFAFETFSFDQYDCVISITSAEAKNIITKPETLHICYCLTPTRYLWSGAEAYQAHPGLGYLSSLGQMVHRHLLPKLRAWDMTASSRPDYYLAISDRVKKRIETYYHREVSSVIYPPVDVQAFTDTHVTDDGYYLTVARFVGYKRLDILIQAFNKLGYPLKIIGDGREKKHLQSLAKNNIEFISSNLTDSILVDYYQRCHAFVFAADEDFGLVAVEAQACGKPVIAYKESGVAEIIQDGVTGVLYPEQTVSSLIAGINKSNALHYDSGKCIEQASHFEKKVFQKQFAAFVEKTFSLYNT